MKEILYLHTGTSYLAAHFFNTLQSYFTYDDGDPTKNKDDASSDEVKVDHDVSFQEGCNQDVWFIMVVLTNLYIDLWGKL